MKKTEINIVVYAVISFTFLLVASPTALGARLDFDGPQIISGMLEARVLLNTSGDNINAVEGKIVYPRGLVSLEEINIGQSVISFWIDQPDNKTPGEIEFSGIIPGGIKVNNGELMTLVFKARKEGLLRIDIDGARVLANDGFGSAVPLTVGPLSILLDERYLGLATSTGEGAPVDNDPPEPFTIMLAKDPSVYNGKSFLVFSTQDKGVGIDHYEAREGSEEFVVVESPYLLRNQKLNEMVFVRAIDKSGNQYIATMEPVNPPLRVDLRPIHYFVIGLTLLVILAWFFFRHHRVRRSDEKLPE